MARSRALEGRSLLKKPFKSPISGQTCKTSVHLIDIFRELTLRQCPCKVLIVYSKIDLLSPSGSDFVGDCAPFDNRTVNECRQLLRIHHLKTFCRPNVSISEALFSAVNGQGLPFITYWLQNAAT